MASDGSLYGIGVCILHKMEDESLKPIAHGSRTLFPVEKSLKSRRKHWELFLQLLNSIDSSMEEIFLWIDHKPLLRIYGSERAYQLILQTGCKDGEPFSFITILKWSFSHLQKLVMPMDCQDLSQNIPNPLKTW